MDEKATIKNAKCVYASPKALKVQIPRTGKALGPTKEKREVWVPHSAIHDDSEVYNAGDNAEGKLVIAPWLAEQLGVELD